MTIKHTDDAKVRALAVLQSNDGNVKRTSEEVGIPRSTIQRWVTQALADGGGDDLLPTHAPWAELRERAAAAFMGTAEKGREIVDRNLNRLRQQDMSVMDLQRVAVTVGIMADKAKHLRGDGPEIVIDARHQAVLALDHVSLEDLRALLAEVRAQTPVEAGVVPSTESPRGVTSPATPAGSGVRLHASVRAARR